MSGPVVFQNKPFSTNNVVSPGRRYFCESCREYFDTLVALKFHYKSIHRPRRNGNSGNKTTSKVLTNSKSLGWSKSKLLLTQSKGLPASAQVETDCSTDTDPVTVTESDAETEIYSPEKDLEKRNNLDFSTDTDTTDYTEFEFECTECGEFIPQTDYLPHVQQHAHQLFLLQKKTTAKMIAKGISPRRSLYSINDPRSKNREAILRCSLCPDEYFTSDQFYRSHRNTHKLSKVLERG